MANGYKSGKGGSVYNKKGEKVRDAPSKKRQKKTKQRVSSSPSQGEPF